MKSESCCHKQTVRSTASVGEVFRISAVHSVEPSSKQATEAMSSRRPQTEKNGSSRWIIVDDNEERLSLIRIIAVSFGDMVDILCFNEPQDAVTAFEAEPEKYEFIVTDLEVPSLEGHELRRHLRAYSPLLKFFYSIAGEIFSDEEAVQKGFCEISRRPFPFALLQPALEPATLKYVQKFSGLGCGMKLVCAK
jgi:CheY-like chemotaxis protein